MRSKAFTQYKKAFCKIYRTEEKDIIRIKQGGMSNEQGTYLHPRLAIVFTRWISAEFAVWCDMIIFQILTGEQELKYKNLKKAYDQLEDKTFDLYELIQLNQRPKEE